MNIAHLCVLLALAIPYLFVAYAKADPRYMKERGNNDPRAYAATLEGKKRRAYSAQLNGFEAFPAFAAGVLLAEHAGGDQGMINLLSMVFVAARVAHGLLYIADLATLRSLAWSVGVICVVWLLILSI